MFLKVAWLLELQGVPGLETREERWLRLGRLKPEEKVNMAIDMTEAMVRVCAEGILVQNPSITEEELIEKLRERLEWCKRWQKRER
jgi:hypothetical protein